MKLDLFPQDIIDEYDLTSKLDQNRNVHCEVRRGMYGLPQAGFIAQELLEERLQKAGYTQSKLIPGYLKHTWQPISFTLIVDGFGIKYIRINTACTSSMLSKNTTKLKKTGKDGDT